MKRMMILILSLSMVFATTAVASDFNKITYITEQYPPFNFEANGQVQGIFCDLMQVMMKRLDIKKPIEVLPWANGYNQIQTVPDTCLFSMTYTDKRAPLFKWVGPVVDAAVVLVAMKKNNIRVNSIEDINKYKIGVIRDDIGEQLLKTAGVNTEIIEPVPQTVQNIKKLYAGRVDMIAYGEIPLMWEIKQNGYDTSEFETVYRLNKGELYYAFHKDTPESVIQGFQKEVETLKADGTLQGVLDQYLK